MISRSANPARRRVASAPFPESGPPPREGFEPGKPGLSRFVPDLAKWIGGQSPPPPAIGVARRSAVSTTWAPKRRRNRLGSPHWWAQGQPGLRRPPESNLPIARAGPGARQGGLTFRPVNMGESRTIQSAAACQPPAKGGRMAAGDSGPDTAVVSTRGISTPQGRKGDPRGM